MDYIDLIVYVANHEKMKNPHVAFNLKIERWMVDRIFSAAYLIKEVIDAKDIQRSGSRSSKRNR
jgi:hypothetical protein